MGRRGAKKVAISRPPPSPTPSPPAQDEVEDSQAIDTAINVFMTAARNAGGHPSGEIEDPAYYSDVSDLWNPSPPQVDPTPQDEDTMEWPLEFPILNNATNLGGSVATTSFSPLLSDEEEKSEIPTTVSSYSPASPTTSTLSNTTVTPGTSSTTTAHATGSGTSMPPPVADGSGSTTTTTTTTSTTTAKKRAAGGGGSDEGKKRKKQKRSTKLGSVISFGPIPLCTFHWPTKPLAPTPHPERVFYPQNDGNAKIEVYSTPNLPGVSIRQYVDAPYERRLNLSVLLFNSFFDSCDVILSHYDRIQKAAEEGLQRIDSHTEDLDPYGSVQVLVNLYRGKAKIHVGTHSYIQEMMAETTAECRRPRATEHCGHTISVHVVRDILHRVGRVLQSFNFTASQ